MNTPPISLDARRKARNDKTRSALRSDRPFRTPQGEGRVFMRMHTPEELAELLRPYLPYEAGVRIRARSEELEIWLPTQFSKELGQQWWQLLSEHLEPAGLQRGQVGEAQCFVIGSAALRDEWGVESLKLALSEGAMQHVAPVPRIHAKDAQWQPPAAASLQSVRR